MKELNWDDDKNALLKKNRDICFEDVAYAVENGFLLDNLRHPNKEKYPEQQMLVIEIDSYAFLIPYIENDTEIFLKTIIPSRKATKKYLSEE